MTSLLAQERSYAKGWHARPPFAGSDPNAASQQTGSDPGPKPLAAAPGVRRGFGSNIDLPGLARCAADWHHSRLLTCWVTFSSYG